MLQLGGCDRCAFQTLAVGGLDGYELRSHSLLPSLPGPESVGHVDVLVVTGAATTDDIQRVQGVDYDILVAYGTCPVTGGVFGLARQKGADIIALADTIDVDTAVYGCPPSVEQLEAALDGGPGERRPLCETCERTMKPERMGQIVRPLSVPAPSECMNNQGIPCSGVVSLDCAQRCVDFGAPCRGCVPSVADPSASMIGYFGSLAADVDVHTEASEWTTDMLGDGPDGITEGLVDVVGTFFRFTLATAFRLPGRQPSAGSLHADIMVGRPIEEAPQLAATVYGLDGISVCLNLVEAYESAVGIEPSPETVALRGRLREVQRVLRELRGAPDLERYSEAVAQARAIGGNDVMSNVFFGGFRTPVKASDAPYEAYAVPGPVEVRAVRGEASDDFTKVSFTTDENGLIREWSCEL